MSMSPQEVQEHMMTYLESTECQIIEKSPYHVTVKLSPQADRQLTGRPYYWGFVDRTGAEPETLSFTFVFDPERYDQHEQENRGRAAAGIISCRVITERRPSCRSSAPGASNARTSLTAAQGCSRFGMPPARKVSACICSSSRLRCSAKRCFRPLTSRGWASASKRKWRAT